jgi:hypothetical protein
MIPKAIPTNWGTVRIGASCVLLAVLLTPRSSNTAPLAGQAAIDHAVTQEIFDRWKTEYSNWGRWGADDEKGTLNLITPKKRLQAARLVKDGFAVSLARDITAVPATAEGQRGAVQQKMLSGPPTRPTGSTDSLTIAPHGYEITHFDAFGHHLMAGKMYNGHAANQYLSMSVGFRGEL